MGNFCCNNYPKINVNEIIKIKENICKIEDNSKFEETKNILGSSLKITVFEGDKNDTTKRILPEKNINQRKSIDESINKLYYSNIELKSTLKHNNDINFRRKSFAISMDNLLKIKFLFHPKKSIKTNNVEHKVSELHHKFKIYEYLPNQSKNNLLKIELKSQSNQEIDLRKNIDFRTNNLESKGNPTTNNMIMNYKFAPKIETLKDKKKHLPIEIINKEITIKQKNLLIQVLTENELISSDMSESFINMIINTLTYKRYKEGIIIFDQDSKFEDLYYIIEKGKIEYCIDDNIYELPKLNGISNQALLKYSKKKCYIKAIIRSYLFELPLEKYRKFINDYEKKNNENKFWALKKNFFFSYIDDSLLIELVKNCPINKYKTNTIIIESDKVFDNIYYIYSGEIKAIRNDIPIKSLKDGEIFGEIGLFNHIESLYEYKTFNDCSIIEISYNNIFLYLGDKCLQNLIQDLFKDSIKNDEFLSLCFTNKIIKKIYNYFQLKYYFNDTILTKTQKKIILPISGTIIKSKLLAIEIENILELIEKNYNNRLITYMFNTDSVTTDVNIMYNLIADEVIVFECDWYEILPKILTNEIFKIYRVKPLELEQTFRNISLFKYISPFKMYQIMNSLKEQKFKNGQIILKDGPKSEEFFYIFNGDVNLNINGIDLKILNKGKSFGDISSDIINYPQKTNFISKNQTILFSIDKDTYNDIVNKSDFYLRLRRIIDKNDNSISLQNLFYLTELGRGSFGKVYLVHNKQKLFALKTTQIEVISENKEYASLVLNEKTIMSQVDHPFIVRLKNTFKTKDFIFFLMEYIDGMNMRKYLELKEKKELRKLDEAQFFGGILFTVLHYLSKRKIIHRDLKPDNLMMNKNGYIKVIDFGVAKYLRGKDYTNTVTGTPHYMSPEVILGKPYSFEVDYWSVGIILYEIFYGMVPFGYATDSINEIYKEILECNLHLPSDPKNENFNNLIKCLLYKISSNRISVFSSVKNHIFFKDFDFEVLLKFNYEAPCKPGNNLISGNEDDLIKNENVPFLNFMQNNIFQSVSDIDENFLKTASESMLSKF